MTKDQVADLINGMSPSSGKYNYQMKAGPLKLLAAVINKALSVIPGVPKQSAPEFSDLGGDPVSMIGFLSSLANVEEGVPYWRLSLTQRGLQTGILLITKYAKTVSGETQG